MYCPLIQNLGTLTNGRSYVVNKVMRVQQFRAFVYTVYTSLGTKQFSDVYHLYILALC